MVDVRVTENHGIDWRFAAFSVEAWNVWKNVKGDQALPISWREKRFREELASQAQAHPEVYKNPRVIISNQKLVSTDLPYATQQLNLNQFCTGPIRSIDVSGPARMVLDLQKVAGRSLCFSLDDDPVACF